MDKLKKYLKDFWILFTKTRYFSNVYMDTPENQHRFLYIQDGVTAKDIKRKIEFCHPCIEVTTNYPPDNTDADVCVINLRKSFDLAEEEYSYYKNFDGFMDMVKTMVVGYFSDTGIYTNIKYPRWVGQNAVNNVLLKTAEKSLLKRIIWGYDHRIYTVE